MSTRALVRSLAAELESLARANDARPSILAERALLRAGEIECLLADHRSPREADAAALSDHLAALAAGACIAPPRASIDALADLPPSVHPSPPEGFAYYAVQPARFAERARDLARGERFVVIGVRTIGATLSAIVAAALRLGGGHADRFTVRPHGHPYARVVTLSDRDRALVDLRRDARFVIVDEGPGMSGSSFLAAAEAITAIGVDPGRITLLGTRAVDPRSLLADRAGDRFGCYAPIITVGPAEPPEDAGDDLSGGAWRARFWPDEARWPASFRAHERVKRRSRDGQSILKFDGLGRWGEAVRERSAAVARAGFGPAVEDAGGGFTRAAMVDGHPLSQAVISAGTIARLAEYCAFRAAAFPVDDADASELQAMADFDAEALLGRAFGRRLVIERPVIADARLHPHEWIERDGVLLKVDAGAHGDDHLFPGPTDIAWDLAGAIVEWSLTGAARDRFLDRYMRASGDRPEGRLPAYIEAYALLHAARARMAAGIDVVEAARLTRDEARYRRWLWG